MLAVVALTALLPTSARARDSAQDAAQDSDGIELQVEAGYDGRYLLGRRLPVFVTIVADRLVRGVVEVAVDGQRGTWSTPVEVPGGTEKPVVVVVSTPFGFEIRGVDVRLSGAGDAVTASADVEPLESEELAGLLPSVTPADLPPPLSLPEGIGIARFIEVDNDTLAVPGAIDPLGSIVAGPGELDTLDGAARRAVLDWIDRGGRLVVDAQPGTPVPGLPDAWQPGDRSRVAAGLGEVRLSAGAAAAGNWGAVIEPTPTASLAETQILGGFSTPIAEPVGDSVARDAGLDALDLPWLLGFLAAYVVLAGPVGYFAIRRRRPALGWVLIPALAVVFSALAFVIGSDLRSSTKAAQGSIVESSAAGARVTTLVGTVSRSGGDGEASFPAGWTGSGVDTSFFGEGMTGNGGEVTTTARSDGAETTVPLAAGGFGVLRGTGPTDAEGALVVEARVEGDAVVGTVRNDHPFTVDEVGVFLGRAADNVGSIEPGASANFEVRGNEFRLNDPFFPPEDSVWPQVGFQRGQPDLENVVNLGILNEALTSLGPNARPRGLVTAIGWTRSYDPPVDVGGEGDPAGRTALIGRAAVTTADGRVVPGAAWRELIRGPEGTELPDDDELNGSIQGAVWRFTLPAGASGPFEVDIPRYVGRLDAWNGSAWVTVDVSAEEIDPNNFDGNIGRQRTVALPDEARLGDIVWFRGFLTADFGALDGAGLDLHTAGAPA